ncbi:hypothetical protein [Neomegalonema sp.]|uniref:hypothetical protein n=1 Tax=Neomegalonema sp. TaxID=2039713 RepID=UPI002636B27D|nr:hypothetical protein [Neomegalonema sp.]MDD2867173.1 hypothetical protein [Neomegalonema sp.]
MTLGLKAALLGGLHRPRQVVTFAQPQGASGSGAAWNGAYGPSWMTGSSSGNWRNIINGGGAGGASGGLQSTSAPGSSSGWIGAPSWSNSNAKWRQYYASVEQQPQTVTVSHGRRGLLGAKLDLLGLGGGWGRSYSYAAPAGNVSYGYGYGAPAVGVSYGAPAVGVSYGGPRFSASYG